MQVASEALVPLHSVDFEMSTLGCMIIQQQAVEEALKILSPDDFYLHSHRVIFTAMRDLAESGKPVDLLILKQFLDERGLLSDAGSENYLIQLGEFVPSAAHVKTYANEVLEKALARNLDTAGHDIIRTARVAELNAEEKIDKAERLVFEIGNRRLGKDFVDLQTLTKEYMVDVDTLYETKQPILGLPTHIIDLDEMTTGLYEGDFVIIAARPSMGKTSLVLKMALNVAAREKKTVALFSLEMGAKQLARRFAAMLSELNGNVLKKSNLSMDEYRKLVDACEDMYELPIYIDETSDISAMEMRGKCRRLQREHGLGLIVVDYLQLMRGSRKSENRVQEISDIARSLKSMAKEMQVPVIALSQLNRAVESRDNKRPQLSDIRESGSIEAEADLVIFIYRDEYYKARDNPDEANTNPNRVEEAELIIAKHRNGPTGTVKVAFKPGSAKFENLYREKTQALAGR